MNKEKLLERYPIGSKIRLISMDDPYAVPAGTLGTVEGVDDIGDILVSWENGSSLSVIPGVDRFERV